MRFLLDTDHLVVIQRRSLPAWTHLRNRSLGLAASDVVLCSISFHEQALGAHAFINRAKSRDQLVLGYQMLERSLADAGRFVVLPFDHQSAVIFEGLRQQGIRIGTMDLRIASIALRNRLTLVTSNLVDFQKVPGMLIEDWTRPPGS